MEFQLAVSAPPESHRFFVRVEPEAMAYELSEHSTIVLTFRGPDSAPAELSHYPDALVIWRPADTEVWATTADGVCQQIAGFADNPCPGLDTGGGSLGQPMRSVIEKLFY